MTRSADGFRRRIFMRQGRRLALESLETRQLLAADASACLAADVLLDQGEGEDDAREWSWRRSPYTNPVDSLDVNANRVIANSDILAVVNDIYLRGSRELTPSDIEDDRFLDVNVDGAVSPRDVLMLVRNLMDSERLNVGTLSELTARIKGPGGIQGEASYEVKREAARVRVRLEVEIEDGPGNARLGVQVDGVHLGSLTTDDKGKGELRFSSEPDEGELPLPASFPALAASSTIHLDDRASGVFSITETGANSSDEAVAFLYSGQAATGVAEYELESQNETVLRTLKIKVERASPGEQAILLNGQHIGSLVVDQRGKGNVVFSDRNETGVLPFPSGFPAELNQARLDVGASLSGVFGSQMGGAEGDEHLEPSERLHAWPAGTNLTFSFAPDGTDISGRASQLQSAFGGGVTGDAWRQAVLNAFQAWGQFADINFGEVPDNGAAFGAPGAMQGDSRFGDIRIGGIPLSPTSLAVAIPQTQLLAGSWAGDIVFNTEAPITTLDDLTSIALHEIGHVLGLPHNTDPLSPMRAIAAGALQPTAADIQQLQLLYGARTADIYDAQQANESTANATRLENPSSLQGRVSLMALGDLHWSGDVDVYKIRTLGGQTGPLRIDVQTAGKSLLQAKLTVLDASETPLANGQLVEPGLLTARLPAVLEDQTYYVRIEAATTNQFSVGSYALVASFEDTVDTDGSVVQHVALGGFDHLRQQDLLALLQGEVLLRNQDHGSDDNFDDAASFTWIGGTAGGGYFDAVGSIESPGDLDFYQLDTPENMSASVLTISVDALESPGLIPTVTLLDASENSMPLEILAQGAGRLVVQATGISPHSTYRLSIAPRRPNGSHATGNYRVRAALSDSPQDRQVLASGELTVDQPSAEQTLYVAQTQLFHFAVAAGPASEPAMVWSTIYDVDGNVVFRAAAQAGDVATSGSILLTPGAYIIRSNAATPDGHATTLAYQVLGDGVSRPMGPEVVNPVEAPFAPCPGSNGDFCYPANTHSPEPWILVDGGQVQLPVSTETPPPWFDPELWYWHTDWLVLL